MKVFVREQKIAGLRLPGIALKVTDPSTSFLDQQNTGRHVPRLNLGSVVSISFSGSHPGCFQARRAQLAYVSNKGIDFVQKPASSSLVCISAFAVEYIALTKILNVGYLDLHPVEASTLAFFREVELINCRGIDRPQSKFAFVHQRYAHGE